MEYLIFFLQIQLGVQFVSAHFTSLVTGGIGPLITFADGPGIFITLLSTGPQLKEIVLLQTEQTIPIQVYHLKDVRQHLPVAKVNQHRDI